MANTIIRLKYGNLVKEKATFIVNASNTQLILGSGVSKAFRQHCGGSITPLKNKLKNQLAYRTFGCLKKLATF